MRKSKEKTSAPSGFRAGPGESNAWKKWRIRLWLLMKKQLKKAGYYVCIALAILAAAVLIRVTSPSEEGAYGVYNGGGETAEKLIGALQEDSEKQAEDGGNLSESRCVVYTDPERMKRDLYAGQIDCAFVLDSRLDQALGQMSLTGCADYYCTPSTSEGEILKEKIYALLFQEYARHKLTSYAEDGETFQSEGSGTESEKEQEKEIEAALEEKFESYQKDPDLFQVKFVTENGKGEAEAGADSGVRRELSVCGVLLFVLALIFARARFSEEHRRVMMALGRGEGRIWSFAEVLAPMIPASAAFWIFLTVRGIGGWRGAAAVLAGMLLCTLWSTVFAAFFRREAFYLFSLMAAVTLCVLTCPSFFAYSSLMPSIAWLKWLFPLQYIRLLF